MTDMQRQWEMDGFQYTFFAEGPWWSEVVRFRPIEPFEIDGITYEPPYLPDGSRDYYTGPMVSLKTDN